MYLVEGSTINEVWHDAISVAMKPGTMERCDSRNGWVEVANAPVVTVYSQPQFRVLLDTVRDANPFFHLFEALWMLAGWNDGKFLDNFVSDFSTRYAEDNGAINDAYGYRWRYGFGFDQLDAIVHKLKNNPADRQAVLQMWDCAEESVGFNDLLTDAKTRPCNTHAYFRCMTDGTLDMTVMCRSNDVVWGCYGANAVHFSVLHEVVAARLGYRMGFYRQFSNNWHIYDTTRHLVDQASASEAARRIYPRVMPIMDDVTWDVFESELVAFLHNPAGYRGWSRFLRTICRVLWLANAIRREEGAAAALKWISEEEGNELRGYDWVVAAREWLERRVARKSGASA